MESDQIYLENLIKGIVEFPDQVRTERSTDDMGVLISLSVDPSDMGKIIGKQGVNAQAIRTIMRAFGSKQRSRINIKILEPENSVREYNRNHYEKDFDDRQ